MPEPELEPLPEPAFPPPLVPELVPGGVDPSCGGVEVLEPELFELPPQPSSATEARNMDSTGERDMALAFRLVSGTCPLEGSLGREVASVDTAGARNSHRSAKQPFRIADG